MKIEKDNNINNIEKRHREKISFIKLEFPELEDEEIEKLTPDPELITIKQREERIASRKRLKERVEEVKEEFNITFPDRENSFNEILSEAYNSVVEARGKRERLFKKK